jgi:hypothetical protein
MLAALLTLWLFGGGSAASPTVGYVDQVIEFARNEITDGGQRKAVLATAKELKKAGGNEAKLTAETARAVARIAGSRAATLQDYQLAFSPIHHSAQELQEELIRQRFGLKAQLTREQWSTLHASRESEVASR